MVLNIRPLMMPFPEFVFEHISLNIEYTVIFEIRFPDIQFAQYIGLLVGSLNIS